MVNKMVCKNKVSGYLKLIPVFGLVAIGIMGWSCKRGEGQSQVPPFPYEEYLELTEEDQLSPNIGDDGRGYDAISNKIRYPEFPKEVSLSPVADTLLLMYNTIMAYNTMVYDSSTADRYLNDTTLCIAQANAIDSINLSGIKNERLRDAILACCKTESQLIRNGIRPSEQENPDIDKFYDVFGDVFNPFMENHYSDEEFAPENVVKDYASIHRKAITDTLSFRSEMLKRVCSEQDFQKKCVLAREFAYANRKSKERNDKELVAVIDPILRANEYSPVLYDLWLMWRTALQSGILGSPSNDGAMYNLFYIDMRNRVAVTYLTYLTENPTDKVAFNKFTNLAMEYNIIRNSPCLFGNNAMLDEMSLYNECFDNDESAK